MFYWFSNSVGFDFIHFQCRTGSLRYLTDQALIMDGRYPQSRYTCSQLNCKQLHCELSFYGHSFHQENRLSIGLTNSPDFSEILINHPDHQHGFQHWLVLNSHSQLYDAITSQLYFILGSYYPFQLVPRWVLILVVSSNISGHFPFAMLV